MNQASLGEVKSMAASFSAAFDDAELWLNETQLGHSLIAFVGFRGRTRAGEQRTQVGAMSRICGAELLREWARGAPLNTDDFPIIEFSAAASHLGTTAAKTQELAAAVDQLRAEDQRRRSSDGGAR